MLHIYFQYDFNLLYPYIKCYLYNFNLIGEKSIILHVAIALYRLQCILEYLPTEGKIGNIKVKKDNSNFVNFFLRWREDQGMA